MKDAVGHIHRELKKVHVLEEHQMRSIAMQYLRPLNLEMDCLAEYLARITSCALGKYYMKDVGGKGHPELTTTRNLILEIMIKAPKN